MTRHGSIFGVFLALALAAAPLMVAQETRTGALPAGTTSTLPLQLRQDQSFEYSVKCGTTNTADAAPAGRTDSEPGLRPGETGRKGATALRPAETAGTQGLSHRWLLRVRQAAPGGSATIDLEIHPAGTIATGKGQNPDLGSTAPEMYSVMVGRNGEIVSLTRSTTAIGLDGERIPDQPGARPLTQPSTTTGGLADDDVRYCLQCIFASGLHDQELKIGQVYTLQDVGLSARTPPPVAGEDRPISESGRGTSAGIPGFARHPVQLRFEGTASEGQTLARFTEVPFGATAATERLREVKTGNVTGTGSTTAAGSNLPGQVTYRTDDGLLQSLAINHGKLADGDPVRDTTAGVDPRGWITVARVGGVTEKR